MTALIMLACVPLVMWIVQTVALRVAGMPIRWRIDARNASPSIRNAGRVTTQLSLVALILLVPLTRHRSFVAHYAALVPWNHTARHFAQGSAAATLCLTVLFLAWIASGRVRVELHQSRRKWTKRLIMLIPTALFGAFVEEFIFRGIVMAELQRTNLNPTTALLLSAFVFAAAHYVRAVKRRWTFPGHFALGCVLCMAFAATGSLWLAAGIHAGGIFMIMGMRPFLRYDGPAWLTGASIFPFAGVAGLGGLAVLASWVARYYPS
ncbi:MAG: CPBP family intramembrane metalloprotease [Planctomycetes bacterium]|nr:CPBP family intramembrane metalloprotease [Planctomycetota bacterium]